MGDKSNILFSTMGFVTGSNWF